MRQLLACVVTYVCVIVGRASSPRAGAPIVHYLLARVAEFCFQPTKSPHAIKKPAEVQRRLGFERLNDQRKK